MSDHDKDSRTERASEKRLREAREKGDSPRSRDFSAAAVTLAGVAILLSMRHGLGERVAAILHDGLSIRRAALYDGDALGASLLTTGAAALPALRPLLVAARRRRALGARADLRDHARGDAGRTARDRRTPLQRAGARVQG